MAAYNSYNTLLKRGATTIAAVKSIRCPMTKEVIDVTHLQSADRARERLMSFRDFGPVAFELIFDPTAASHELVEDDYNSDAFTAWSIVWSDAAPTTWTFSGGITKYEPGAAMEEALMASAEIAITGKITMD